MFRVKGALTADLRTCAVSEISDSSVVGGDGQLSDFDVFMRDYWASLGHIHIMDGLWVASGVLLGVFECCR